MRDIADISLPTAEDYRPEANPNEIGSKVAIQHLQFLHEMKEKLPNCEKIKRYIKLHMRHYEVWYPKIRHEVPYL